MRINIRCVILFTILFPAFITAQTLPSISSGKIKRLENFKSDHVQSRNIDVWLPEDYSDSKKYNVIYMHDGQMLFDSTKTWNHKEWKVDETFSKLIKNKVIEKSIVVAIWNTGADRISEYMPNKILDAVSKQTQKTFTEKYCNNKPANGDNYLKFIVLELKPFIDKNFATLADKDHTFIMGSSMGGIISLYAISEYPQVFGGAASLSTAWLSMIEPNFEFPLSEFNYLKQHLPDFFSHKIYMDYGTGESNKTYETVQNFIDIIARAKGYNEATYMSKVFEKDEHNEVAWSNRLHVPLNFLLPKVKPQQVVAGKIDFIENFDSKFVTTRNIEIWLPDGYSNKKKYAVLYMHDGQMLYDPSKGWNKQAWDVDDVSSKLLKEGNVQDFIVVGIWNGGETRHTDYFPQKPFENLTPEQKNIVTQRLNMSVPFQPASDNYLKFMITELKPYIDANYAVYTDRKHTFVAGSSMGGLISMYTLCEYPKVFGGAACLSTHWPGIFAIENNPIPEAFNKYLKTHLPLLKYSKLYFDYGDQTLDAMYPPLQKEIDNSMNEINYEGKYQWQTQFFPGKDHSENAWKERLHIPLKFLLKK